MHVHNFLERWPNWLNVSPVLRSFMPGLIILLGVVASPPGAEAQTRGQVQVSSATHHAVLPSLRDATPKPYRPRHRIEHQVPLPYFPPGRTDGALQSTTRLSPATPSVISSIDGIGDGFSGPQGTFSVNSTPPDTDGAVGATQYVQAVNNSIAVFDKTNKTVQYGPVATNTLWSGFGGDCENNNDGDAVVAYDKAANRWVISQFSVSTTPYLECVAVSQTSDATGAYDLYAFSYGNTDFPDYPKMGVWPDGYYISFNVFDGKTFLGAKLCAYDRASMLTGSAATQQCVQLSSSYTGVLPSDLDGATPPPAGSPNYFLNFDTDSLDLWKFHVDWANAANSMLTGPINIPVATFTPACPNNSSCVPQNGTTQQLDSLPGGMMFRLAYRNFGDHESLVVNQSVAVGTTVSDQHTGVRWYEIRDPNGTPVVYQQSTFSPDTSYRWMGSVAMDKLGDMALGYSVSDSTMYPAIRFTGRLASDTLSTMAAEVSMIEGTGSQSDSNRWGDYSGMTIDPVDDCTFWYTTEYLKTTGGGWSTRIGSFQIPGCLTGSSVLVFTTQPSTPIPQGDMLGTIEVTEEDGSGNTVLDNSNVDFSVATSCGALDLGTVAMSNGVATLNSTQRFYTQDTGLVITATVAAPNPMSIAPQDSAGFDVTYNSDLIFSSGFESCSP